jgi:nitrite reductase/ring-hydroxylating ferredoxin subunit
MQYVRVASTADLEPGQIMSIDAGGHQMMLANVNGTFRAAQRKCPHLGFNLCKGKIEGQSVVCPLHKAKFDLETGKVQREPKLLFLQMTAKSDLQTWPVRVDGSEVLVGL